MKNKTPFFGPGGNSEAFYASGKKSTVDAPAWLREIGLDAYEYEAGKGIMAGEASLRKVGEAAALAGIKMSLHAPYFISLSGVDPEKRLKSVDYIMSSVNAAELLGADTIVVHCGSASKISREEALKLSADTLLHTLDAVQGTKVKIGIETMGKQNQLGTLEEVIALCKIDSALVPVVDFGHMNARECGGTFNTVDDYMRVFDAVAHNLGASVAENLHCHFSKIEWSAGGEKRHLTFEDEQYGPSPELLVEAIHRLGVYPTVICESAGTQSDDALYMKKCYLKASGN